MLGTTALEGIRKQFHSFKQVYIIQFKNYKLCYTFKLHTNYLKGCSHVVVSKHFNGRLSGMKIVEKGGKVSFMDM